MRRTRLLTMMLLAAFAGARGVLLAQQGGTGYVSGQVIEGGTTRPVPGAVVSIAAAVRGGPQVPASQVVADARGRFVFSGVPAGQFRIQTSRPGWRTGVYGSDRPLAEDRTAGGTITLAAGGRMQVSVPLWRDATISGVVTDETGEPIAGATVESSRWVAVAGRRRLGSSGATLTDDRGRFTVVAPAGEWMLLARTPSDQVRARTDASGVTRRFAYEPTFYPQSRTVDGAQVLTLKWSEDRTGIVIPLRSERAVRVAGTLRPTGDPGAMPRAVQLLLDGLTDRMNSQWAAQVDPQGRFTFANVPAGRYFLKAGSPTSQQDQDGSQPGELWAQATLDVGSSDLDVSVDLHRPLRISGRVQFEGTSPSSPDAVSFRLFREEELPVSDVIPRYARSGMDGRFTLSVIPGRYVIGAGGTRWALRTATSGGRNIADVPIALTSDLSDVVLTFTDRGPVLRGRVTSRQGSVESATVVVFPDDPNLWREFTGGYRFLFLGLRDGAFEIRSLPEGDYLIAAVRIDPLSGEHRHAGFLAALARVARRVSLRDGETVTQDVELTATPPNNMSLAPPPVPLEPLERAVVREVPDDGVTGAVISGRVIDIASKAPIASARISAGITPGAPVTFSDQDGRFSLSRLAAGQHTLVAAQTSYVVTTYGASRPGDPGTPISVTAGQRVSDVVIAMTKGAALSGTVVDQGGVPLPNIQVNLRAYRWQARGRELVVPQRGPSLIGLSPQTDARGVYRAFGLPPGDYVIQVTPQGGNAAVAVTTQADLDAASGRAAAGATVPARVEARYAPMFYPNTPDPASAQVVKLASGDDRVIDFEFELIPTATVSGTLNVPPGMQPARIGLTLTPSDPLIPPGGRSIFGTATADGAFTIGGVPPGRYVLATSGNVGSSPRVAGSMDLFVDGDRSGLVLDLLPQATVSGQLTGAVVAQNLRVGFVHLSSPANQPITGVITTDGRFSASNVPPGRYRLELTGGSVNAVKPRVASQIVNGHETIDSGFEVRGGDQIEVSVQLTTSEAQVTGLLRDRAGQPATRPFVILFAKDAQAWTPPSRRIFGLRPDQNGRYLFPDVPAGEYLLSTLVDVEPGEWYDPAVLARLAAGALPVSVRSGDKLEIDLETR